MSLAAFGALSGLGQGLALTAREAMASEDQRRREEALLQRERERQAAETARNDARLEARLAGIEARAGGGASAKPQMSALELMRNPELVAMASGRAREDVDAALDLARNGNRPVELGKFADLESAPEPVYGRKYTPGEADRIRVAGATALRQAMGLANPGNADDLAKGAIGEYTLDAARRAEGGDTGAVRGALTAAGKTEFSDKGTSGITGAAAKGSIAESEIDENRAQAGKYNAEAKGGGVENLKILETERKNIDQDISGSRTLIKEAREALKTASREEEAALKATIKEQEERIAAAQRRRDALSQRITELGGAKPSQSALDNPPPPNRPLPSGVSPSAAGAGRGAVNPPMVKPKPGDIDITGFAPGEPVTPQKLSPEEQAKRLAEVEAATGELNAWAEGKRQKKAAASSKPVVTRTKEEYDALPSGALYIKDGKTYRKG